MYRLPPPAATAAAAAASATRPRREQPKKKEWSPAEQEYLDKMADAPIIYKRIPEEEFYPSVG